MLMYSTIAKNTGNSDKQVANMLITGFTGQLKGWWDNYVDEKTQQAILNTVKTENGITTPNVVYTLTCTIIEHFTGRWSDNSENIQLSDHLPVKCSIMVQVRVYTTLGVVIPFSVFTVLRIAC
uniref:DUF7746 domain-containing protein n=1 Tax=Lactuca sativa TaxID=4236 RepID=A0A9R1WCF8_LACSA|nr:hypothetical protein LSAT_V11C200056520 [Lactuca sativa]